MIYSKNTGFVGNVEFAKRGEMKDHNSEIMAKDSSNIMVDAEIYTK